MRDESLEKVRQGFAEIVPWDSIRHKLDQPEWSNLKISPLTVVPHKSRKFRAILDLSFKLRVFGKELPSVNSDTVTTAPSLA